MPRRKKIINNSNIPQHKIEAIARCLLPDILECFENDDWQREFAIWKEEREREKNNKVVDSEN